MEAKDLVVRYQNIRQQTVRLCDPLTVEDHGLQTREEVSPPRWHLGHTTWFFDRFLVKEFAPSGARPNEEFQVLFNSYYEGAGRPWPRERRGQISRPGLNKILDYRQQTDDAVSSLIARASPDVLQKILPVVKTGLSHEQQHQELLLMDIKHNFSVQPSLPAYQIRDLTRLERGPAGQKKTWFHLDKGLYETGLPPDGEGYDNEKPRHQVFLEGCKLATHLVTNGEFKEFVEDGGYQKHRWWVAEGWQWVQDNQIRSPLYHIDSSGDESDQIFTLHGVQKIHAKDPVCHISWYEADAFARWAGYRLPTEEEWEAAATKSGVEFEQGQDSGLLHPVDQLPGTGIRHLTGQVWQWTSSQYRPYPGFRPYKGLMEEYNGKFMCNQFVLKGGACVTPASHTRASYRNFFRPFDRWQFAGIRLASDSLS